MAVTRIVAEPSLTAVSVTRVPATAARHRRTRGVEHRRRLGGPSHARRPEAAGNAQGVAVVARPSDADHPGPPRPPALPPTGPPPPSRAPPGRRRQSSAPCIVHLRRGNTRLADLRVGCPLPAVLPAVSCTASRFLTRSDPQSPLVFPTNTGFLGFSVESRTGSKPGTRGTSSRSSALSTGDSTSARREHTTGSAGPESRFTHRSRPTSAFAHRSHDAVRLDVPFPDENLPAVDPARRYGLRRRAARLLMEAIDELPPPMLPGDGPAAFRLSEPPLGVPGHELDVDLVREREYRPRQVNRTTLRRQRRHSVLPSRRSGRRRTSRAPRRSRRCPGSGGPTMPISRWCPPERGSTATGRPSC